MNNTVQHLIHVGLREIHTRFSVICLNQSQKVIDNLGLTINFRNDVCHEFAIILNTCSLILGQ